MGAKMTLLIDLEKGFIGGNTNKKNIKKYG